MKKALSLSLLATIILSGCVSYGGNVNEVSSHQIFGVYLRDNPSKYSTYEFNEDLTKYHSFGIKPPLPDDMFDDNNAYSISLTKDNKMIRSISATKEFKNANECLQNLGRYAKYLSKYHEMNRKTGKGTYDSGDYDINYTVFCGGTLSLEGVKSEDPNDGTLMYVLSDQRLNLK